MSATESTATKLKKDSLKVYILALDKEDPKPYPDDLLPYHGKELGQNARDYMAARGNGNDFEIVVKYVKTMPELWREMENDAFTGGSLFDAYYTNPLSIGASTQLGGLMDFTPYIKAYEGLDWTDVLPAFRSTATNYEDKVQLILLDGDTHFMYYRKDVLDHFGLQVPRTWDEYIEVAKATHGKTFEGKELSGSCIGRQKGDHAQFWYHLVHSTITQTQGTETGSLLDTKTGKPLLGDALAETIRLHEGQAKYGSEDEFTGSLYQVIQHMHDGTCALSFYWGDIFKTSKSTISEIGNAKLGVAPTPGSTNVLDRETGKLVQCTKYICPYGRYYEDIGWVNSAPYVANGGWGGAVSANTDKAKQDLLADFFLWSTSRDQSLQYVIPNATGSVLEMNTQDPWRKSHLDIDEWVKRGYDASNTKQYVETLLYNTNSKNAVVEMRFPKAADLYAILDADVFEYMKDFKDGKMKGLAEEEKANRRAAIGAEMERKWDVVIQQYNNRGDTKLPILDQYQILRGVYEPNQEYNYLTNIVPFGIACAAIVILCSIGFGLWTFIHRKQRIIRASQPIFLGLICLGTIIMGSAIIPLGIDDSAVDAEGCAKACTSVIWMLATGFSLSFSALFAKVYRLNTLFKNAKGFKRVKVEAKDVMLPLVVLMTLNIIFLGVWTGIDPFYWVREETGRTSEGTIESIGMCKNTGSPTVKAMMSLVIITNVGALLLSNYEAYKARSISIEYSESKYIGFANAFILQAFLIGIPLLVLVNGNPVADYFVKVVLIFIVCLSILGFIFVPKIIYQKKSKGGREDESGASGLKVIGTFKLNRFDTVE